VIRLERNAPISRHRSSRIGDLRRGRDADQRGRVSAAGEPLSHQRHDTRLGPAVDDHRLGFRRGAGDAAAEQLCQPGNQLLVEIGGAPEDEDDGLQGLDPNRPTLRPRLYWFNALLTVVLLTA
jgi:hypothetical protein